MPITKTVFLITVLVYAIVLWIVAQYNLVEHDHQGTILNSYLKTPDCANSRGFFVEERRITFARAVDVRAGSSYAVSTAVTSGPALCLREIPWLPA